MFTVIPDQHLDHVHLLPLLSIGMGLCEECQEYTGYQLTIGWLVWDLSFVFESH